ncbi:ATP-binding domain-containing protein [Vulgatibacter incomptus]|uniref:UvrD/Rep helicase family protein n=1 Tax=Vulgatibacter incomptus TaxID=1391653 RepID=A0A0K1PDE2_9BACT|nr:ATP-binding domain-containing protein [Vulgatibacter incomptus]AKU91540.1 UvrD/Rep helicase family protein [Vulgatibacter incomptus]
MTPALHPAIAEEEALLARVHAALVSRKSRRSNRVSSDELRELRDEAVEVRAEDASGLLHELALKQRLRNLPDRFRENEVSADSPYLGHLRIRDGNEVRDYLLGHATFIDDGIRLVDWRVAPVAQIFYRYREGDSFEESFPGRDVSGVVELRRVVVIHRGVLVQILGDDFALWRGPDGSWTSEDRAVFAMSPGGAGSAARPGMLGVGIGEREARTDVTALLDAEQFRAISTPPEEPLLVLGSAGSGKTTVALHRLARLTAKDPARYPVARSRVVVPEEGLARLSARLLQPIGGGPAQVRTMDSAFVALANHVFGKLPPLCMEPPALVSSLKRHPALYDALRKRLGGKRDEDGAPSLHREPEASNRKEAPSREARAEESGPAPAGPISLFALRRRLATLFTDRTFLGGVVAASGGTLPIPAIEDTVQHTMKQLAATLDRQLASITDDERKQAIDGRNLAEGTPDELAGSIDVEELPLLLAILAWRGALRLPEVSHLVLDEAEDFSLFDLEALAGLVRRTGRVTLAGDEAQQTHASFAGWERSLATLGVAGASTCRLPVSYRCPRPIAEVAREILGHLAPQAPARASRDGAPVGRFAFPDEAQAWLFLSGALRDLVEREPRASVAVIAHDAATARRFHGLVEEIASARLVADGRFTFEPGLDVTDVDCVKGLEFDYVVVPDATAAAWPETDDGRRRLHVAVTRASHQLWLVSPGTASARLP